MIEELLERYYDEFMAPNSAHTPKLGQITSGGILVILTKYDAYLSRIVPGHCQLVMNALKGLAQQKKE